MQSTEGFTTVNQKGKHILATAILTIILGYGVGLFVPQLVDNSVLTGAAIFGVIIGSTIAGLATAHIHTGNLIMDGIIGGAITAAITAMFMGVQAFSALWVFVFVGAFLATIVSKKVLKKKVAAM